MKRLLHYHETHAHLKKLGNAYGRPGRAVPRDDDLAQGDAYLVAAHACIEFFFEELCRHAVHSSIWRFSRENVSNRVLDNLQSAYRWNQILQLPRGGDAFINGTISLKKALEWYIKRVDENNGVKPQNLWAILMPLGFSEGDFDPLWLNAMDAFGEGRGDMAHGRPTALFGKAGVPVGSLGETIRVWSQRATRTRIAMAPWDVEHLLEQLKPELLEWDRRIVRQIWE